MSYSKEIPTESPSRKIHAALIPLMTVPFAIMVAVSHDKRLIFAVMACYFAALGIIAHQKKLHMVVRLALVTAALGAIAAIWFYSFSAY